LANQLGASLQKASILPTLGHASARPLDNLTCPAVAIEIAPLPAAEGGDITPITNPTYQQHIAQAIVTALIAFRNANAPANTPVTPAPKPTPPSAPKPAPAPDLNPATPVTPAGNDASTTGGNK
jgi:N-acetylmuramoyl-L-alanine amidase